MIRPVLLPALLLAAAPAVAEGLPSDLVWLDGWTEADGTRIAAVAIRLAPGWKTYWRTPGEAGIPPRFDWAGSENVAGAEVLWPVPATYEVAGARYFGYEEMVVLPVRLTLVDPAAPAEVRLAVEYGVCGEVCLPATASVEAALVPGAPEGDGAGPIRAALAVQPATAAEAGVASVSCTLTPQGEGFDLTARIAFAGEAPQVGAMVVESPLADLWIAPADAAREGRDLVATARLDWFGAGPLALDRASLRLTMLGDGTGVEIRGCPAPPG